MHNNEFWNEFWQFSCKFYPHCQREVLDLQNKAHLSVNMLLFCCWLGSQHLRLTPANLQGAKAIADKHEADFISPLRELRRRVKDLGDKLLYQRMKDLELAFEKRSQNDLFDYAKNEKSLQYNPDNASDLSEDNLLSYIDSAIKGDSPAWVHQHVKTICANLSTIHQPFCA